MLFFCNPKLRKLEAFMQEVPGFPPKGMKIDLDKLKDEIVLFKIESVFFSPKNIERKEKEKNMKFRNEQHRSAFLNEVKNQSLSNHKLLAVLYLLTAEASLWNSTKDFVKEDEMDFSKIRLKSGTESAYALFCAAKDLYNGSRNMGIDDISDCELVKGSVFSLICNAMAIKRKGLAAVITM